MHVRACQCGMGPTIGPASSGVSRPPRWSSFSWRLDRTAGCGATSYLGMDTTDTPNNFLFSITLYRDGTLRIDGKGRREALPSILRMIADSLEAGATTLTSFEDD